MNKEYALKIDLINMLLRFMVTFTFSSIFILLLTGNDTLIWKALILLPVSVVSFLIERYAKSIWIYLLLHFALFVGCISMTEDIVLKIAFGMFVIVFAVLQYAVTNISLHFAIIFLLIYIMLGYAYPDLNVLKQFFFYMAIIYGLCYLLNNYYINFCSYFQNHEEKTNIPIKQIKSSNRFMITGFLSICFTVMIVFSRGPFANILRIIGGYVKGFFRLLTNRSVSDQIVTEKEILEKTNLQRGITSSGLPEADPSKFMEITAEIASVLFLVLFIAIIGIFLIKKFYKFYQFYYRRKIQEYGEDLIEIALPIEKKRVKLFSKSDGSEKGIFSRFGSTNNERIRKHYAKAIYKNASIEKGLKYKTPTQLSDYAISPGEQSSALTAIYEKARYSKEDCSKGEVQSVKNLLK